MTPSSAGGDTGREAVTASKRETRVVSCCTIADNPASVSGWTCKVARRSFLRVLMETMSATMGRTMAAIRITSSSKTKMDIRKSSPIDVQNDQNCATRTYSARILFLRVRQVNEVNPLRIARPPVLCRVTDSWAARHERIGLSQTIIPVQNVDVT